MIIKPNHILCWFYIPQGDIYLCQGLGYLCIYGALAICTWFILSSLYCQWRISPLVLHTHNLTYPASVLYLTSLSWSSLTTFFQDSSRASGSISGLLNGMQRPLKKWYSGRASSQSVLNFWAFLVCASNWKMAFATCTLHKWKKWEMTTHPHAVQIKIYKPWIIR